MINKITVIGSTGVLGTKLLSYLNKNKKKISLITCYTNYKKLLKQKKSSGAKQAIVLDAKLKNLNNNLKFGEDYLLKFIKSETIDLIYILNTRLSL